MDYLSCCFVEKDSLYSRSNFHPLHLHSDKVKWMTAFGRSDSSSLIVSLCPKRNAHHSYQDKLFVVLHLDHHPEIYPSPSVEIDENVRKQEEIVLISSGEFHQYYGISKESTELCIAQIPVFPLSRVIISARNENTFNWANDKGFERGLMISGTHHKSLLARRGDQFLASPQKTFGDDESVTLLHFQNLVTLECYPVKQGYIHAGTEVIISEGYQDKMIEINTTKSKGGLRLMLATEQHLQGISSTKKFDQQCEVLCREETAQDLNIEDGDFIVLNISFPQQKREVENDFLTLNIDDENSQDEGEYFSIDMPRGNKEQQVTQNEHAICRLRVCQNHPANIFSSKDVIDLKQDALYLSSLLWFNMTSFRGKNLDKATVEIKPLVNDPPFAKEIHLSLILSPTYSPGAQFDNTLVKHLSSTRILKLNDVICIKTQGNSDFLCECTAKDARCSALYYKVMKLEGKEENNSQIYYQVNVKNTALYQDGTTNSFVPRLMAESINADYPLGLSNYVETLKDILSPYIAQEMDSSVATVLLSGGPGSGKWSVVSTVAQLLNIHVMKISCHDLMSDSSGATDAKINTAIQRAVLYSPCIIVLNSIECIGRDTETGQADHRVCSGLQNAIESLKSDDLAVAVVAITSNVKGMVPKIRSLFLHQVEINSLSEKERRATLQQLITMTPSGKDIDIQWIAKHTVGFTYAELWELLRKANENARERITSECAIGSRLSWIDEMSICAAGITTQHCDFTCALQSMQSQRADIIGVPKIPDVKWEDIGGLEEVKNNIKDTIQLPLQHPELVASGLRRSGILLYGPPGTGKTLLAKAVATQCSLSFLSVKGPELINMYVGQSEENVRKVFSRARDAAPCVVFFDELDSLAPNRGRSGDSGGVMDRVVSQLLAELDGLVEADSEKQIFVIGASNRPDLIDPALLRPGRFDKLLYVGINANKADQLKILEAQTRRANLSPEVRLDEVIEACPDNMTGADFYALTSEALMNAIRRRIKLEESYETEETEKTIDPLTVEHLDFMKAVRNINPSVSKKELLRFQEIKNRFTSRK
ncbi:peroxisomal ATPase PEX6-like [Styela clava]